MNLTVSDDLETAKHGEEVEISLKLNPFYGMGNIDFKLLLARKNQVFGEIGIKTIEVIDLLPFTLKRKATYW